jgi:hypothetical protein
MSDTFVSPKIEHEPGGDTITVKSGGSVVIDSGGSLTGTRIQRRLIQVVLPSATALSTVVPGTPVVNTDLPLTVKSVKLLTQANVAGHATSNTILTLNKLSALATATTAVATLTFTTSNAATAYIPVTLTLATTAVNVAAGESLVAKYTFASSGQDFPIAGITVEHQIDAT